MSKQISHVQGKGSIAHNNRWFTPKNVDPTRTKYNITYIKQDIREAYIELFGTAVEEYNAKQKRKDRRIEDYYQHLFSKKPCNTVVENANGTKSFYEDVVQIGTMEDTAVGTPDGDKAIECLDEYMKGFQKRNPNFYVFNAVIHSDEKTPHLHLDYIGIGHYKKGLSVRNGLAKALEEMGYGNGKDAINRWRQAERKVLADICISHGIEVGEEKKGRGYSYTVGEYKEHQDKIREYTEQEQMLEAKKAALEQEIEPLLDKKAIADDHKIDSKTLVGGYSLVKTVDVNEMERQRKALAIRSAELKDKSADSDIRERQIAEKEKQLAEQADILDNIAEAQKHMQYELDKEKTSQALMELHLQQREEEVEKLYDEQIEINAILEDTETELDICYSQIPMLKKELSRLEDDKAVGEKTLERERRAHQDDVDRLTAEKEELRKDKEATERSLNDELAKVNKEKSGLQWLCDTLYDIAEFVCDKLGLDLERLIEKCKRGHTIARILNDESDSYYTR